MTTLEIIQYTKDFWRKQIKSVSRVTIAFQTFFINAAAFQRKPGSYAFQAKQTNLGTKSPIIHNLEEGERTFSAVNLKSFYFFFKITRRKLKCGNNLLCQSLNYSYCSRQRDFPYSYSNTAFSQLKLTKNVILQKKIVSKKYIGLPSWILTTCNLYLVCLWLEQKS